MIVSLTTYWMGKFMYRVRQLISDFQQDSSGAAIIWATTVMMVIVALVGLAIDGARYMNLNSNLQEIADGAALAGAAELDGSADAITRATDAALHYLDNNPNWSDIARSGVQIASDETYGPKFTRPWEDRRQPTRK